MLVELFWSESIPFTMELYQIRYFLSLCSTLNFTRAAEQCNVSQPALTRAIKKLEDELGGELFRRERSRTHMTELGRAMQPYLQQSLDSALAAKEQAASYGSGKTAPLHLGISATIEIRLLLPALRELARVLPGLKLCLVRMPAKVVMKGLQDGEIELCVTATNDSVWERINQWPLFSEDFVLFAGSAHSLAHMDAIEYSDLKNQQIYIHSSCESSHEYSEILQRHKIPSDACHEFSDQADLNVAIGEGQGVRLAPQSTQVPEKIISIPIKDEKLQRTVTLFAVSGRRYSLAASGLMRLLRSADWSRCAARVT